MLYAKFVHHIYIYNHPIVMKYLLFEWPLNCFIETSGGYIYIYNIYIYIYISCKGVLYGLNVISIKSMVLRLKASSGFGRPCFKFTQLKR